MKKILAMTLLTLTVSLAVFNFADAAVHVKGYFRSNGTYVQPYYRSNPDSNPYNNWSFPGNTNPYTGKVAPGNPDTYLKNYYNKSDTGSSLELPPVVYPSPSPIVSPPINIPLNAYQVSSSWACNDGYVNRNNNCISYTEDCINYFGVNIYGTKGNNSNSLCYCSVGFKWNDSHTACINNTPTPTPTPLTAASLQLQINDLMAQLTTLQKQLNEVMGK